VPAVKLVYVVRDPVERMRSHYRHELQRGRERRAFTEAVSDVDVPYVDLSLYWERLGPYVDAFPPRQLSVVRFEDLVSDEAPGWDQVLDHLGLSRTARPEVPYNITVDKPQFSKLLLRQWQRNRLAWTRPLPPRARRMGKRLMTRNGRRYRTLLDQSVTAPLPVSIEAALADDAARLADWLGRTAPLW
jgi:hypothetical protein